MNQTTAIALNSPLTTDRLYLEPLKASHADRLFAAMQETRIYTWISSQAPQNVQTLRAKWAQLESRLSPNAEEAWLNWAVRRKSDNVYVGKIDAEINVAQIATNLGYIFFPPFWRNGYAYEAIHAVIKHFAEQDVKQIRATVTVGNDASARLLEKLDFVLNRIIPANDTIRGVKCDDLEYLRSL